MLITLPPNTRLQDYLLSRNIHILTACGGRGNCGKCAVRVVSGEVAINTMDSLFVSFTVTALTESKEPQLVTGLGLFFSYSYEPLAR